MIEKKVSESESVKDAWDAESSEEEPEPEPEPKPQAPASVKAKKEASAPKEEEVSWYCLKSKYADMYDSNGN